MKTAAAIELRPLLVREKDLPRIVGLSRSSIRREIARGRFPKCVYFGRVIAWRVVDLERWVSDGCGAVEPEVKVTNGQS
jgi:predicted DNA-binding transcriptional regulator AlpA